jgi:hypothetical protein
VRRCAILIRFEHLNFGDSNLFRISDFGFRIQPKRGSNMSRKPNDIALNILANVMHALGPSWEQRLTPADRALVKACCVDAAQLGLRALATPGRNAELQTDLLRERAHIHAQLSNCAALGAGRVAEAFWEGFRATINGAVTIAFTAL